jgi:hypothetical protein
MYGGKGRGLHIAYVGVSEKLKQRVRQHLIRRNSSVTTGVSVVALNPELVCEVRWWEHPDFTQRHVLEAGELVAFEVFNPSLRSRGKPSGPARELYADESFREKTRTLFAGKSAGRLILPSLEDALERIAALEQRLAELERRVAGE